MSYRKSHGSTIYKNTLFIVGFARYLPILLPSLLAWVKVTFVFPPVVKLTLNRSDKHQNPMGSKRIQKTLPPEHNGTWVTPEEFFAKF